MIKYLTSLKGLKRTVPFILVAVLVAGCFFGCGGGSGNNATQAATSAADSVTEAAAAEATTAAAAEATTVAEAAAEAATTAAADAATEAATTAATAVATEATTAAAATNAAAGDGGGEFSYPLDGSVTLRYWNELNWNTGSHYANLGDTPYAKVWQERTGINVEFDHAATDDAFTLLMFSNDLPDIIEYWWSAYPGGILKAVEEGVIIPLNDLWDSAPLYRDWLDNHQLIAQQIVYPGDMWLGFPAVIGDGSTVVCSQGPCIRQDILDNLGLSMPETIEDWHSVLTAFRDSGIEAPLSVGYNEHIFMRAYGLGGNEWYVDGAQIKYARFEPAYRDYMAMWSQWYSEGLIDKDCVTIDTDTRRAKLFDGTAAASVEYWSGMQATNMNGVEFDPNYNMMPAPFPKLQPGDRYNEYSNVENPHSPDDVYTCVTSGSKYPEIAARLMDYLWGAEGNVYANWGVEGQTFEYGQGGSKHYTDFVLHNPDGWTIQEVVGGYMRSYSSGPYAQDPFISTEKFAFPQQVAAFEVWSKDATLEHILPPFTLTLEEAEEFSRIMVDVKTVADENSINFMLGTKSLDEYDAYIEQLRSLNIERAIQIQNDALQRYLNQ